LSSRTRECKLAPMMSVTYRTVPNGARVALIAILTLTLPRMVAAEGGTPYVRPSYPVPYLLYRYPGACLPYGSCAGPWWWEDRRQPRRPVAPEQPSPPEQDIWGSTGSPWGYVRRFPPPTPESHIQPRYRDASTLRPEFAEPAGLTPR
jgi:hypothetical protein